MIDLKNEFASRILELKKISEGKKNEKFKPNIKEIDTELINNTVTKSNALIRSYYKFSLVEKRIMEAMISKINPLSYNEDQAQEVELSAAKYAELFDVSKQTAYENLRDAVSSLLKKTFSIEGIEKRIEFNLMSHAIYIEKQGKIICSFTNFVLPHIVGLRKHFTKYALKTTINFKSVYCWRFYELIISWKKDNTSKNGWFIITVDELRKILGVPASYNWASFNQKILEESKKEIESLTDIIISINVNKKIGKKTCSLKIIFSKKKNI